MIATESRVCEGGTRWWRQDRCAPDHHLNNWKVMLWVVVSIVTALDGAVSPDEDKQEVMSPPLSGHRKSTEGHRLQGPISSIVASRPHDYDEAVDARRGRWSDGTPYRAGKKKQRGRSKQHRRPLQSSSRSDCRVQRKETRVRDLGLGYDSDEIILFKYCVGTCHSARRNYDLALRAMMSSGGNGTAALPLDHRSALSDQPCCRPTRYESVSFMDAQTTWRTIRMLSAADCSCVG